MADIASSDVTITIQKSRIAKGSPGGVQRNVVKIAFGDGALTYPTGGVPMPTFPKFGMRRELEYLILIDSNDASGIIWKWDYENKKLTAFLAPVQTHAHDLLVKGGQAASTTNNVAHYATDILGKEAATDATIAGSASATKGGVLTSTVAIQALTVHGNTAVAAQVLYAEAVGW